MACCDRCAGVHHRSYELSGDGDGIEFLTETDRLPDGTSVVSVVVFCASGISGPAPGADDPGRRRGGAAPRTPPAIDG
jgi:hypothetical protein